MANWQQSCLVIWKLTFFGLIYNNLAISQKFVQWKRTYQTISSKICATCAPFMWHFFLFKRHFFFFILRFELSLLLHLTPTLSAPLTFCKFAQKWGRFHLKQCYTKMTASTRRSFWYLMILTWNAVHNPLESIEGKVLQFYDFHKFSSVFSRALS